MPNTQPTFIRTEPGKPWPDPPAGGSWSRDPATGDLTLVTQTAEPTDADRQARREALRGDATAENNDSAAGAQQE